MSPPVSVQSIIVPRRQVEWLAGVLLLLIALAVYIATLANGLRIDELLGGDVITHHYAQVEGRPANTPGYPIYTMLGWFWFRLGALLFPWFNPIEVLSSYSTVWAVATLGVFYALLLKITRRWPIAFLIAAFYAFTYFFWYYAITSEEYSSAVLQTLLFVWWAIRWQETRAERYLLYSALNIGLCLANLLTVLTIVPALAIFYLSQEPALLQRGRLIARGVGLALLPLLSYVYVFLAGWLRPEWRGDGEWSSVWHWFSDFLTKQAREEISLFLEPLSDQFARIIVGELTAGVLVLSLIGASLLGRRRAILIYVTFTCYLLMAYITRHANWYQVIMPLYPILLLGFGAAIAGAWERLPARYAPVGRTVLLVGLTALVVARFLVVYPDANRRDRPEDHAIPLARSLIRDDPQQGALIYGVSQEIAALRYLTVVWGERPDIRPLDTAAARRWLETTDARPLYVTRSAVWLLRQELGVDPPLSSAGRQLIEVLREPRTTPPAEITPINEPFIPGITLAGLTCLAHDAATLHVALYWQTTAPPQAAVVSLRPLAGGELIYIDGALINQDHHPVWNAYPFDTWSPGEIVRDDYLLELPPDAAPDGLHILAYRPAGEETQVLASLELPLPACQDREP